VRLFFFSFRNCDRFQMGIVVLIYRRYGTYFSGRSDCRNLFSYFKNITRGVGGLSETCLVIGALNRIHTLNSVQPKVSKSKLLLVTRFTLKRKKKYKYKIIFKVSGVHLNFRSKLALKSRLSTHQLFKSYHSFCVVCVFTRVVRSQSTLQRQL
jgi:hypothetical protein